MKKLTVLVVITLVAGLLAGCWLFPERLTIPELDGIVSLGEWDDATEISVAEDMGTVKVLATTGYLYVLFDVVDSTDARLGQPVGNDKFGLNINPTEGGPYDIVFQTGTDPRAWQGPSSGLTNDYETQWLIDGTQYDIPPDLDTITLYSEGMRVSEWKIPLISIDPSAGDVLKIGGATDIDVENHGLSFRYPIGLLWADVSTYVNIIVH